MNREILNYALKLLDRKDYTEKELENKLIKKFADESREEIETVLSYLKEKGFLDDRRYCENYVYFRLKRGYGKRRVEYELRNKGLDEGIIKDALEETDEQIEDVFLKRLKQLKGKKRKRAKLYEFMIRRGFESDRIIELLNRYEVRDDEDS